VVTLQSVIFVGFSVNACCSHHQHFDECRSYVGVVDVTEETFETDVVERSRELPVVVDFWAEWCGPCHALAPVLEREAAARDGRLSLVKVDVDANPRLADEYDIRGIPAVKAFRNGRVVREFVGAQSPQSVGAFLDEVLAPSPGERLLAELRASGDRPELLETLEAGEHERALELLLAEVREEADAERRDELRRLMVALFDELGPEHPLATRFRRQLAAALY
jgi:putative thioredoxin